MRVLVIGGTGQTGRLVIGEALQRGHTVTALVRNPSALATKEGLTIIEGTPLKSSDVEGAFSATPDDLPAAVIMTLSSPKEPGTRVMADAHENLIAVMRKHDVLKIATMSSFGVGSSFTNLSVIMRWAIPTTKLAYSYADHNNVDEILKKTGLNFVLLRPSRLTMAKKAPVKFYGDDGKGISTMGAVSRASVASCLLDVVEKSNWDRQTPVIAN